MRSYIGKKKLTFIMAAVSGRIAVPSQYPVEKIMVG